MRKTMRKTMSFEMYTTHKQHFQRWCNHINENYILLRIEEISILETIKFASPHWSWISGEKNKNIECILDKFYENKKKN